MMYNFNLIQLVIRRIPWALRKPNRVAWVSAMLKHLDTIQKELADFVDQTRYKLNITGQTVYLEHYLNDLYDDAQRRIYIQNNDLPDMLYLFTRDENEMFYVSHVYDPAETYNAGDVCNYAGIMYECQEAGVTGVQPDTDQAKWTPVGSSYFLTRDDFDQAIDFTIYFPADVVITTELERKIRGQVATYVVAGFTFNIENMI